MGDDSADDVDISARSADTPALPTLAPVPYRIAAFVLDGIAVTFLAVLFGLPAQDAGGTTLVWVVWFLAQLAVVIAPIARIGRSPGAWALGIRVARLTDFEAPGWTASTIRWGVANLPWLLAAIVTAVVPDSFGAVISTAAIIGWIMVYAHIWVSDLDQGVHDLAAGTVVVHERRRLKRLRLTEPGE